VANEFVAIQNIPISRICKQSGLRHTHTHTHARDCEGCGLLVVIPFAKHVTGREEKFEMVKECLVPRQRTE